MRGRGWTAGLALAVGLVLPVAGCGSGERDFDAAGVVEELNQAGAGLELGEALPSTDDVEVTTLGFTEAGAGEIGHEHGAGAVVILDDAEAARAEFARCESAISFICFRAANAVLRFSEISAAEQERIATALRSLENVGT